VIPEIISQLSESTTVKLGNNSTRDFLYAGDAVRMAVDLLERGQFGEVYNLGSEECVEIYKLAEMVGQVGLDEKTPLGNLASTEQQFQAVLRDRQSPGGAADECVETDSEGLPSTRVELVQEAYRQLELEWSDWAGVPNVVACATGTAALQLALSVLKSTWPAGKNEVIVPEFTMIACARAVTMAGLVPRFVDCGIDLLIDCDLLEKAITPRTAAIMPVHEAHGAPLSENHWDVRCWSFYRNKIVGGEEGGAVAFRNPNEAEVARLLRCLGFTDKHDFNHLVGGMSARLSNANAEPILRSLRQVQANLHKRRKLEAWYDALIPDAWRMPRRQAPWVYDLRIPGIDLDRVVPILRQRGIEARHGFKPLGMQPEYHEGACYAPEAYQASREVMYLPLDPRLTREDADRAVATLLELCPAP
jgi:dTDP-4-amino-4,6-dideoxygalactose transaminase